MTICSRGLISCADTCNVCDGQVTASNNDSGHWDYVIVSVSTPTIQHTAGLSRTYDNIPSARNANVVISRVVDNNTASHEGRLQPIEDMYANYVLQDVPGFQSRDSTNRRGNNVTPNVTGVASAYLFIIFDPSGT